MVECTLRNYQRETAPRQSCMLMINLILTVSSSKLMKIRLVINLTTIRSWSVSIWIRLWYRAIIILRGRVPLSCSLNDVITLLTLARAFANQTNKLQLGCKGNSFSWFIIKNGSALLIIKKIRWRTKREVSGYQSTLRFVKKQSIKFRLWTFICKTIIAIS